MAIHGGSNPQPTSRNACSGSSASMCSGKKRRSRATTEAATSSTPLRAKKGGEMHPAEHVTESQRGAEAAEDMQQRHVQRCSSTNFSIPSARNSRLIIDTSGSQKCAHTQPCRLHTPLQIAKSMHALTSACGNWSAAPQCRASAPPHRPCRPCAPAPLAAPRRTAASHR